jgi:uncharacterized protein YeeX (DUF496 family)
MSLGFGNSIENPIRQARVNNKVPRKPKRSSLDEIKGIRTELEQKSDFLASLQESLQQIEKYYFETESINSKIQSCARSTVDSVDALYPLYTYTDEYILMLRYSLESINILLELTKRQEFIQDATYINFFFLPVYLSNFVFVITHGDEPLASEIKLVHQFVAETQVILHSLIQTAADPRCVNKSELQNIITKGQIFGELYYSLDSLIYEKVNSEYQDVSVKDIIKQNCKNPNYSEETKSAKSQMITMFLSGNDQTSKINSWVDNYKKILDFLPELCICVARQSALTITFRKIYELKSEATQDQVYNYIINFLSNISFMSSPIFLGDSESIEMQSWRNVDLFKQLQSLYFHEIFELKLSDWQDEFSTRLDDFLTNSTLNELHHMRYLLDQNLPIEPWLDFLGQKMNLPSTDIEPFCIYDLSCDTLRSYLMDEVKNKIKKQKTEQDNLQLFDTSRKLTDREYRLEIFKMLNEYVQSVGLSVEQIKTLLEGVSKGHNEQFLKSHLVRLSNTLGIGLIEKEEFSQNYYMIREVLLQGLENIYRLEQLKNSTSEQSELPSSEKIKLIFKELNQEKYKFCIANSCSIPRDLNKHWLEDLSCLVDNLNKVKSMSDLLSFRAFDSNSRFSTMEFKSLTDSNNSSFSIRLRGNKIKNRAEFRVEAKNGKEIIYLERLGGHD